MTPPACARPPARGGVPARHRVAVATALCLAVHGGCTEVEGGAVELSWKLRPASSELDDKFVECDTRSLSGGAVRRIQLDWEVLESSGGSADAGQASWPCTDNNGATGFDLPEGSALLKVTPICDFGPADPASYIAPPPQRRAVILGDTVSLGAVELVLQVSDCDVEGQVCVCEPPAVTP